MTAAGIAEAALQLIGTRFRLHGRDPAYGLDCLGLVGEAMRMAGLEPVLPRTYRLRQREGIEQFFQFACDSGLEESQSPPRRNDILLFAVPGAQHHLAIAIGRTDIVHAHAGLRRVVQGVPDMDWRLLRIWRAS